jgi:hypothetical protein
MAFAARTGGWGADAKGLWEKLVVVAKDKGEEADLYGWHAMCEKPHIRGGAQPPIRGWVPLRPLARLYAAQPRPLPERAAARQMNTELLVAARSLLFSRAVATFNVRKGAIKPFLPLLLGRRWRFIAGGFCAAFLHRGMGDDALAAAKAAALGRLSAMQQQDDDEAQPAPNQQQRLGGAGLPDAAALLEGVGQVDQPSVAPRPSPAAAKRPAASAPGPPRDEWRDETAREPQTTLRIAVQGCAHGELDAIYSTIAEMERTQRRKIDLLLCCGDFQSVRFKSDLECMAVPVKFRKLGTFYRYCETIAARPRPASALSVSFAAGGLLTRSSTLTRSLGRHGGEGRADSYDLRRRQP